MRLRCAPPPSARSSHHAFVLRRHPSHRPHGLRRTAAALLNARSLSARALNGGLPGTSAGSLSGVRAAASPVLGNRAKVASGGVAALALGALLLPGHAAAQTTVHPTVPGSSVFTASAAPQQENRVVQVAAPSTYKQPRSVSSQDSVAVAHNLAQPRPSSPSPPPSRSSRRSPPSRPSRSSRRSPPSRPSRSSRRSRPARPGASPGAALLVLPAPGAPTSNPYHKTNHSYAAGFHTGVDFAVRPGTPLVSVGDATVVSAGWAARTATRSC
ncbi:hypothetical protein ACFQ1I_20815 [Kitasatospora arboriphila]